MKYLFFVLFATLPFAAQSQHITTQDDKLVEWECLEKIENLAGCKIEIANVTNISTGKQEKCVSFSKKFGRGNSIFRTTTLLEKDEVDALIAAIPVILKRVEGRSPKEYTEIYFRSRNGMYVGCFKDRSSWTVVIKVDEDNEESYAFMHRHDLNLLLDFLQQAKAKL